MPTRDIVTIGGSAGSLDAFRQIVECLPPDLPAAVFIVMHLSPRARSYLADILAKSSSIPVSQVADGDRIEHGRIYVCPPDRHLLIAQDHVHLTRGPKEGLQRPSINVTFRSAAVNCGARVIGVLVSGLLDDGAAGIWEIAQYGGTTIVQNPSDAPFPSMPLNALQDAAVDYKLNSSEIGPAIVDLATGRISPRPRHSAGDEYEEEHFSGVTCPECRGPLYTTRRPGPIEFRCRVGHVISLGALMDESTSVQERALYQAIVALQEGADLASFAGSRIGHADAEAFQKEADQLRRSAEAIRKMIEDRVMPSIS
jgi:two-component system, chemotaxis family, protein-glutamate methylesterase/glutaminase